MRYKGFFIEHSYGYYEVYQGDDLVCTTDTMREAREECDRMEDEMIAYAETMVIGG